MMARHFLAWTALLGSAFAAAGAPAPARVERVGDAIVFEGRIDAESAAAFLQLAPQPGVHRLVITSGGGLVAPALDMADAVFAHHFDVEVPDKCLSSCANYVFPAGRHKLLGRPDAVGWHGNMTHVLWLADTGQASWNASAMEQARALAGASRRSTRASASTASSAGSARSRPTTSTSSMRCRRRTWRASASAA